MILTGCRRGEIGRLRWTEIDFATGVLTLPGERVKNRKGHALHLPQAALDILRSCPRKATDFIFDTGDGGYRSWGVSTANLKARIAAIKDIGDWRLHDLRRSCRTGLGKLGVPPHIAELVIGHVKKGVEAIYDRHKYQDEIALALKQWADHVFAVVERA